MKITDVLDINAEAKRVHIANAKWWIDIETGEPLDRDKGEQLMLITTELSEAMEGHRKHLVDDKLPSYMMEHAEIIDVFIRALDYRYGHGYHQAFIGMEYPGPMLSHQFDAEASIGEALGRMNGLVETIRKATTTDMGFSPFEPLDHLIDHCYWYSIWRGFSQHFVAIYNAKMAFNATRLDHTIEHRKSEHGKRI